MRAGALHPQAKFDPIPPDLDLHKLVDSTPNFDWVTRISVAQIRRLGPAGFEKLVQLHVIEGGRPLVIEGWDRALPKDLFSATWLEKTCDKKQENVRDITAGHDIPMTTGHYLRSMKLLTDQWTPMNFRDERRQRLYLKDIDCPDAWFQHLKKIIPPNVFYMNENITEDGNQAPRSDDIFGGPERTPAIAGDLMSSLAPEMRAQNLMCYVGHEGTYTPAHREMCASLGQNIMVEASGDTDKEKPGSSIWFMTETKDREVVREYFLSMLGHDIEIERHFAQINAWKRANFPVYIVEQKVGDFILVPPLAPHQVWNRGTRTMKVAWNRTTVETIELALREALPKARLVCRDEQYKNKAIIYYTLEKYAKELRSLEDGAEANWLGLGQELAQNSVRMKQMGRDFKKLFALFTEVLVDEMFGDKQTDVEYIPFDSNITCSYCRSNIFNRFLTCKNCVRELVDGDEDTYDVCMECYVMGRSCLCISGLQWCEQWKWSHLVDKHETWRAMIIEQDGFVDINLSPQPLEIVRKSRGKKSVAQICQEQLKGRPFNDITKQTERKEISADEEDMDEEDRKKRQTKRRHQRERQKIKDGATRNCHVCSHRDLDYKLAVCAVCNTAYCYGVLWRAFDLMPQTVMEQEHWQCPKCLKICNCGGCRQAGNTEPYIPRNTLLGHDTRPIADDRSVEAIVDFRLSNMNWLRVSGEGNRSKESKLMRRLRQQADAEKAKDPLAALDSDGAHDGDTDRDGNPTEPQDLDGMGPRAETANMPGLQDTGGDSIYPDPIESSMLNRGRMMGMGFYNQDESTDRILFDPFQAPTAEALKSDLEMSDYVKKTLRLAKRKARLEQNDDPDFKDSSYRKRPKNGNLEQLINLDPALLSSLNDVPPTPNSAQSSSQQATTNEGQGAARDTSSAQANDAFRLSLRHAKPRKSYIENSPDDIDDPGLMAAVDSVELPLAPELEPSAEDLAADAFRSLVDAETTEQNVPSAESTPRKSGRKRGRKARSPEVGTEPKRPARRPVATEPKRRGRPPRNSHAKSPSPPSTEPKRRGLRSRDPPVEDSEPDDEESLQNPPDSDGEPVGADPMDIDPMYTEPKDTEPMDAEPQQHDSSSDSSDSESVDSEPKRQERPTRRLQGRSSAEARPTRRSAAPSTVPKSVPKSVPRPAPKPAPKPVPAAPKNLASMSLKERLALKGKKNIRIRGRDSPRTATPVRKSDPSTTAVAAAAEAKERTASAVREQTEPEVHKKPDTTKLESKKPQSPPRKREGPTIVQFASSEESDVDSSGSDSDDDDIPAQKQPEPPRGRGRWATRNHV